MRTFGDLLAYNSPYFRRKVRFMVSP